MAKMYPVPPHGEKQGKTEAYIGEWLKKQQRDKLFVAKLSSLQIASLERAFQPTPQDIDKNISAN